MPWLVWKCLQTRPALVPHASCLSQSLESLLSEFRRRVPTRTPACLSFSCFFLKGRCFAFDKAQFAKFSFGSKKSWLPHHQWDKSVLSLRTSLWLDPNPFQVDYYIQVKIDLLCIYIDTQHHLLNSPWKFLGGCWEVIEYSSRGLFYIALPVLSPNLLVIMATSSMNSLLLSSVLPPPFFRNRVSL